MTITFNSIQLATRSQIQHSRIGSDSQEWTFDIISSDASWNALTSLAGHCRKTTLMSGKTSVQTTGTKATLAIDGISYTNCAIIGGVRISELRGSSKSRWIYSVTFVRDTT